jgi:dipeptidyl aminopeptidase/acylaminoacyl peptidase
MKAVLLAAAATLIALAAAAAFFLLTAYGDPSFSDPATATCDAPPATFDDPMVLADHQEVAVHFTCEGAVLAGTVYLPKGAGPHPALVWVHGAGEAPRLPWSPLLRAFVQAGIAILSYDKRGVGASEGECCPGDYGHFNLLAADVVGAVSALRSRSDIDAEHIGLFGASQAGWIAPKAAVLSHHVAFTVLASAPTLTYGEVQAYAQLTGGQESDGPLPSKEEIAERLDKADPSGFDPEPFLEQMTVPGLWLFGGEDKEVPLEQSVAALQRLKEARGKDFTFAVYSHAGHGLFDVPPTDPRALPTAIAWILTQVQVASS